MITLTQLQTADIIETVKSGLIEALLLDLKSDLQLLTTPQVCGLLNVDPRTLLSLRIPRVTLKVGQYRYRACDVAKFINDRIP